MAKRERAILKIEVYVDLDPVPGVFHTPESAFEVVAHIIQDTLDTRIPHYKPFVRTN